MKPTPASAPQGTPLTDSIIAHAQGNLIPTHWLIKRLAEHAREMEHDRHQLAEMLRELLQDAESARSYFSDYNHPDEEIATIKRIVKARALLAAATAGGN